MMVIESIEMNGYERLCINMNRTFLLNLWCIVVMVDRLVSVMINIIVVIMVIITVNIQINNLYTCK